jgi:hypothetical protein
MAKKAETEERLKKLVRRIFRAATATKRYSQAQAEA